MLQLPDKTNRDFVEGARIVLDDIMMYLPDTELARVSNWIDSLEGSLGSASKSKDAK
jgi:hypothetical protein